MYFLCLHYGVQRTSYICLSIFVVGLYLWNLVRALISVRFWLEFWRFVFWRGFSPTLEINTEKKCIINNASLGISLRVSKQNGKSKSKIELMINKIWLVPSSKLVSLRILGFEKMHDLQPMAEKKGWLKVKKQVGNKSLRKMIIRL